jgi:NAD(P)-dependent dehydrogenase (short-subunit alcohol dehydrogenase family)
MKGVMLVTGAGSGIGRAIAQTLASSGYEVYGAARTEGTDWPNDVYRIPMDVTQEWSVQQGIDWIRSRNGKLNGVINAAGLGMLGSIEDSSPEEVRELFETNLLGVHHVCRNALPLLRETTGGIIINITSMGAQIALPYRGIYCASKFAVEGYTEALSLELANDGIRVVMVEPGDVRTAINANRKIVAQISERHRNAHGRIHRQVNDEVENGLHPDKIAELVKKLVEHPRPRLRYRVASPKAKYAYYLMKLLPDRWFESVVRNHYKV